jgi:hypothetical protein
MDPQLIISGLAAAVVSLAGIIFKLQQDTISEQKTTIKEQNERERRRLETQDATTKTLQAVVDVGMERLRSHPPESSP